MAFLLADGVVPSNGGRGYVRRRIMRRAILQGRVLGIDEPLLPRLAERAVEVAGDAYPELPREAEAIAMWVRSEEEAFRRTLDQGERLPAEVIESAREAETSWVPAVDAFRLHDTYGFPYELTRELLHEQGLEVDDQGFAELMEEARERARAGGAATAGASGRAVARAGGGSSDALPHERVLAFVRSAGFETRFRGYETTELETTIGALERVDGRVLAKLEESPFYPEGGGQVSDGGHLELASGAQARVTGVFRIAADQVLELELDPGVEARPGEGAHAVVYRSARLATMANHTATHLLHAALRERLGTHVRQAGSYVGPDKLRFDFTHGERLSDGELADVESRVAGWVASNQPVRAIETTRDEAERLGAMALFGGKYGDWVRMVEIEDVSRELCGGTHHASSAEVGLFHVLSETSSAANVRRIEALTGPASIDEFRRRDHELHEIAGMLRVPANEVVN